METTSHRAVEAYSRGRCYNRNRPLFDLKFSMQIEDFAFVSARSELKASRFMKSLKLPYIALERKLKPRSVCTRQPQI